MNDDGYIFAFEEALAPVADLFQPDIVLVSSGFDTYRNDPLGGISVTGGGFCHDRDTPRHRPKMVPIHGVLCVGRGV